MKINDQVEILLYADGSPGRGMGHLYRIARLHHYFLRPFDVLFFYRNSFQKEFYLGSGVPKSRLVNKGKLRCKLGIFDSKEDNLSVLKTNNTFTKTIAIDSRSEWALRSDCLVFPSFYFDDSSLPSEICATVYSGMKYCLPVQDGSFNPGLDLVAPFVLVTMGGSDPNNLTEIVCNSLSSDSCKGINVRVLIGRFFRVDADYFRSKFPHFEFIDTLNETAGVIRAASLVITALGTTIQEVEFYGKRCVLIFNYEEDAKDFLVIKRQSSNPENWMSAGHFLRFDAETFLSHVLLLLTAAESYREVGVDFDEWASGWADLINKSVGFSE